MIRAAGTLMIASFDLYRLRGTSRRRRRRRFHWIELVGVVAFLGPCRMLHRFVTCSSFILHCGFHIS